MRKAAIRMPGRCSAGSAANGSIHNPILRGNAETGELRQRSDDDGEVVLEMSASMCPSDGSNMYGGGIITDGGGGGGGGGNDDDNNEPNNHHAHHRTGYRTTSVAGSATESAAHPSVSDNDDGTELSEGAGEEHPSGTTSSDDEDGTITSMRRTWACITQAPCTPCRLLDEEKQTIERNTARRVERWQAHQDFWRGKWLARCCEYDEEMTNEDDECLLLDGGDDDATKDSSEEDEQENEEKSEAAAAAATAGGCARVKGVVCECAGRFFEGLSWCCAIASFYGAALLRWAWCGLRLLSCCSYLCCMLGVLDRRCCLQCYDDAAVACTTARGDPSVVPLRRRTAVKICIVLLVPVAGVVMPTLIIWLLDSSWIRSWPQITFSYQQLYYWVDYVLLWSFPLLCCPLVCFLWGELRRRWCCFRATCLKLLNCYDGLAIAACDDPQRRDGGRDAVSDARRRSTRTIYAIVAFVLCCCFIARSVYAIEAAHLRGLSKQCWKDVKEAVSKDRFADEDSFDGAWWCSRWGSAECGFSKPVYSLTWETFKQHAKGHCDRHGVSHRYLWLLIPSQGDGKDDDEFYFYGTYYDNAYNSMNDTEMYDFRMGAKDLEEAVGYGPWFGSWVILVAALCIGIITLCCLEIQRFHLWSWCMNHRSRVLSVVLLSSSSVASLSAIAVYVAYYDAIWNKQSSTFQAQLAYLFYSVMPFGFIFGIAAIGRCQYTLGLPLRTPTMLLDCSKRWFGMRRTTRERGFYFFSASKRNDRNVARRRSITLLHHTREINDVQTGSTAERAWGRFWSLSALFFATFNAVPGVGLVFTWPAWQSFSNLDNEVLLHHGTIRSTRLLYASLVVGSMNSICPGPFALVNAHWTLLVEEQVLKILAISEIKDGRLAFRQELSTPVTFVGVDTFLHLVDILSLVYVSLVVSFWKKSWWILLFIAQPLGIVIRQTLQHFALATTVLDDKRPVQNSRLPSHIIEAQDPQFSWTRVPSFDEVKTWGGSFRGKHWIALWNMVFNIMVLFPKSANEHGQVSFYRGEYAGGSVPAVSNEALNVHDSSDVLIAAVVLSFIGFVVHMMALLQDSYFPDKYIGLRDGHFNRTSFIKTLMFSMKLQLLTAKLYCACDPNLIEHESATLSNYKANCDLGGSGLQIFQQGVLSLQVIMTSGVLALMSSVEVRPILDMKEIPGLAHKKLLVRLYTISTALLQIVTVFLTTEAVFLPDVLHRVECSDEVKGLQQKGGFWTIDDTVFQVTQSNMNTLLSFSLVVLVIFNNIWRVSLMPFCNIAHRGETSFESSDWVTVRAGHSAALVVLVAIVFGAVHTAHSDGMVPHYLYCVAAYVGIGLSAILSHMVESHKAAVAIISVLTVPTAIPLVVEMSLHANQGIGPGTSQFSTDSVALFFMVLMAVIMCLMNPAIILQREAPAVNLEESLDVRNILSDKNGQTVGDADVLDVAGSGAERCISEVNVHPFQRASASEQASKADSPKFQCLSMSLWQAFLVVGTLAILLASLGSTIESSLTVMNNEQLSQLKSLTWKKWKHKGNWRQQSQPFCVWGGVSCTEKAKGEKSDLRVKMLNVPFSGVQGKLDGAFFKDMNTLRLVNFSYSLLSGELSSDVCEHESLQYLWYGCGQTLPKCAQTKCGNGEFTCSGGGGNLSLSEVLNLPYVEMGSCLYYSHVSPIQLEANMSISSTIDIKEGTAAIVEGNGRTLSSSSTALLFKIHKGASLELRNMILTNTYGSSIEVLSGANLALQDCTFAFNTNSSISATGAKLSINATTFRDNSATHSSGGALVAESSHVVIHSSLFTRNTAKKNGGAVYSNGNKARLDISTSQFSENRASESGGALYTAGWIGKQYIYSSNFIQNAAKETGGAVFSGGRGKLLVHGTQFTSNSVEANGGALEVDDKVKCSISSSNFTANVASNAGGAVSVKKSSLDVQSSSFQQNTAATGGAVYGSVVADRATFRQNRAAAGGVFYAAPHHSVHATSSHFFGNKANVGYIAVSAKFGYWPCKRMGAVNVDSSCSCPNDESPTPPPTLQPTLQPTYFFEAVSYDALATDCAVITHNNNNYYDKNTSLTCAQFKRLKGLGKKHYCTPWGFYGRQQSRNLVKRAKKGLQWNCGSL